MTWALRGAPPLFATPRNPANYTDGPQVDAIARHLGTPPLPWQSYTAAVAGERNPDGSFVYPVVVVSVPRQTGKTTLIRASGTQAALVAGRDVYYTAQTGKDARARWADLVKVLQLDPALRSRIQVSLRGGSEAITFLDSGAKFGVFAPTPESLHGYTPHRVKVDECFSLVGGRGELLMGAIGPAQQTILDRQVWLVSTRGTAESVWFHDWIDRAMEGTPGVAGFIWGATDAQDPYDLNDIAAFHPGVGFRLGDVTLTAADVLANAEKLSRAEYERAFANRATVTTDAMIPPEAWRDLYDPAQAPPANTSDVVLAYDVSVDRMAAAILAAWHAPDGRPTLRVVEARNGSTWLADAVEQYRDTWRPRAVAAVGNGPVLDTTAQLRRRGVEVTELGERAFSTACTGFLSFVENQLGTHGRPSTADPASVDRLERGVTGLVPRTSAGDGISFSRRHSVGDSSPGFAATAALHVLADTPTGTPMMYFRED